MSVPVMRQPALPSRAILTHLNSCCQSMGSAAGVPETRIKAFFGTSENAVKTQIWTAISTYVLAAILKKRSHLPHSDYTILQVVSVSLFEKPPIPQLLED